MADPMKCIVKIANKSNLSETITRLAMNTMTQIIQSGISAGKNPMSFEATVLYISSFKAGENITQPEIAKAAGITGVIIRNRIRELKNTGSNSPLLKTIDFKLGYLNKLLAILLVIWGCYFTYYRK